MVEVLRKEVSLDFDEAVERVKKECMAAGFSVLGTKDLDAIFKEKLGVDYPRYTIVLACAPPLAKMAMDASIDAGTLFPCSFVVYKDGEKVMIAHTSIMRAISELGLAPADKMDPVIEETGKRISEIWKKI